MVSWAIFVQKVNDKKEKERYLTIKWTYNDDFGTQIAGAFNDDTLNRKLSLVNGRIISKNDCDKYFIGQSIVFLTCVGFAI